MCSIAIPLEHEQLVFDRACSFRRAAKLIEAGGNSIPVVVCYCVAIEVLLKLLLGESGVGGHDINDLYDMLPQATRDIVHAIHDGKPRIQMEQLYMKFERVGDAFETWRYVYEGTIKGLPVEYVVVSDLEDVWETLVEAALTLKPGLTLPAVY